MPKAASTLVTRRPGFRFSQGQLYITTEQAEMRLGTWPLLEAWRQRGVKKGGAKFVPVLEEDGKAVKLGAARPTR